MQIKLLFFNKRRLNGYEWLCLFTWIFIIKTLEPLANSCKVHLWVVEEKIMLLEYIKTWFGSKKQLSTQQCPPPRLCDEGRHPVVFKHVLQMSPSCLTTSSFYTGVELELLLNRLNIIFRKIWTLDSKAPLSISDNQKGFQTLSCLHLIPEKNWPWLRTTAPAKDWDRTCVFYHLIF